jgi:hypothetical protein
VRDAKYEVRHIVLCTVNRRECQACSPVVRIGNWVRPPPHPKASVASPPLVPGGEGHTFACGRGGVRTPFGRRDRHSEQNYSYNYDPVVWRADFGKYRTSSCHGKKKGSLRRLNAFMISCNSLPLKWNIYKNAVAPVCQYGRTESSLDPGSKWLDYSFKQCARNSEEIARRGRAFVLHFTTYIPLNSRPSGEKKNKHLNSRKQCWKWECAYV